MNLPALNTAGVDVTNTLALIDKKNTSDILKKNYLSEIMSREAQLPGQIEERASTNALRNVQTDAARKEMERAALDEAARNIGWIGGLSTPEAQEAAFRDLAQTMEAQGKKVPVPPEVFYTDGKWDTEKYKSLSTAYVRARQMQLDPSKPEEVDVLNPAYDASKPPSAENSIMIKKRTLYKDGKYTDVPGAPVTPAVDPIGKEMRAEKKLTLDEKKVEALNRAATAREEALIKAGENKEETNRIRENWNKQLIAVLGYRNETGRIAATKKAVELFTNPKGQTVRHIKDGDKSRFEVMSTDPETLGEWIPATPEQSNKIDKVANPPTKKGGGLLGISDQLGAAPKPGVGPTVDNWKNFIKK